MTKILNHVGITVKSLDRSVEFYTQVLGLNAPPEVGIYAIDGKWVGTLIGADDAHIKIAFIPLDDGTLEILEYVTPDDGVPSASLRNWDVGAAHLCLNIDGLADFYDSHRETVDFTSEPQTVESGPWQGGLVVYLRDPDGISIELVDRGGRT